VCGVVYAPVMGDMPDGDHSLSSTFMCLYCIQDVTYVSNNLLSGTMTAVKQPYSVQGSPREGTIEVSSSPPLYGRGAPPHHHPSLHAQISYNIPSGTQGADHPNPGHQYDLSPLLCICPHQLVLLVLSRYHGTTRQAFLVDDEEGREVRAMMNSLAAATQHLTPSPQILDLLKKSFEQRLTFTVGTSLTTGAGAIAACLYTC
jgi:hypothetical protein